MLARFIVLGMLAGLVGLIFLLQLTTPATIHPIGILSVFICIYLLVLGALTFFIVWASRLYTKLLTAATAKQYQSTDLLTAYQYASVVSLAPVMLLAMRTVGALGVADVIFVVVFVGLACFYVWRR